MLGVTPIAHGPAHEHHKREAVASAARGRNPPSMLRPNADDLVVMLRRSEYFDAKEEISSYSVAYHSLIEGSKEREWLVSGAARCVSSLVALVADLQDVRRATVLLLLSDFVRVISRNPKGKEELRAAFEFGRCAAEIGAWARSGDEALRAAAAVCARGVPSLRASLVPLLVDALPLRTDVFVALAGVLPPDDPSFPRLVAQARDALKDPSRAHAAALVLVLAQPPGLSVDEGGQIDELLSLRERSILSQLAPRWAVPDGPFPLMAPDRGEVEATLIFRGDGLFIAERETSAGKARFTIRWPHAPATQGAVAMLASVVDGIARRVRIGAVTRAFDERGQPAPLA